MSRIRIIGGVFRGRFITPPEGRETTRPTTDRVREALFSHLTVDFGDFAGVRVLDAFAGSGACGLEALSRGAAAATFCERDRAVVGVLRGNIAHLGVEHRCTVVPGDAFAHPARLRAGGPYAVVILDPPYATPVASVRSLVQALALSGAIEENATVVYEQAVGDDNDLGAALVCTTCARYATTQVTYYDYRSSAFDTADGTEREQ